MKAPAPTESVLQSSIVEFLRTVLHPIDYVVAAIPNASRHTASGRAANAVPGLTPGIPDLVIVGPQGRSYWLEIKTERGRLSPPQENIRDRFMKMSVPWAVVRSLSDVRAALSAWGLESREAV